MTIRPYAGGSRTNIRLPHDPAPAPTPEPAADPDPEPADAPADDPDPAQEQPTVARTGSRWGAGDAGGLLLGLLAWAWVISPLLRGGATDGPTQVMDVLRAKFLNRGPNGEELS